MIDEVRLGYAALRDRAAGGAADFVLSPVPVAAHTAAHMAIGRDGRHHLFIETPERTTPTGHRKGPLTIGSTELVVEGRRSSYIDIACDDAGAEIFDYFVVAALERTAASTLGVALEIEALVEDWRRFLTPGTEPLTRASVRALVAEMLVLRDLALAEPRRAVSAWTGPAKARHDFRWGTAAIEVKSTRSHTSETVTVHGVDQLVEPDGGRLWLHLVRLEDVPGGPVSAGDILDELLGLGCSPTELFDVLAEANVVAADVGSLRQFRFEVRERLTVPIDDSTPRIVPHSFVGGAPPAGVDDINYRLDISHLRDRRVSDETYQDIVSAFLVTGANP